MNLPLEFLHITAAYEKCVKRSVSYWKNSFSYTDENQTNTSVTLLTARLILENSSRYRLASAYHKFHLASYHTHHRYADDERDT